MDEASRSVNLVKLLPADLEHQILVSFNETVAPPKDEMMVRHIFEHHAARSPAAVAAFFEGESVTYAPTLPSHKLYFFVCCAPSEWHHCGVIPVWLLCNGCYSLGLLVCTDIRH